MRRQRRQNTRLNLGRDPLGAGVAYSQSGFNDLGGILSKKIQQGTAKVASFEKQRRDELKLEEEKAGLMVEGFMANQAEGIDLTAIPDEDKGMITEFSMNQKQIYADAAQAAGGMKAGSPEKLEQIAIMKQANQRLQNVEKQYNVWGGMREDYMQDFQGKNLSVANSSGNMISAAGIFTGAQQRSFDENGNIMFTDEAGNVTTMSDVKQPFEKAYKEANSINETMFKIYNKGQKLDDTEKTYLRNSLSTLIDNAGVEGLQSLAFDKLVGKEAFFNEEERYLIESLDTTNPEELIKAKKDLKEVLLNKMINVADQQANNGFNKKQAAIKPEQKPPTTMQMFESEGSTFMPLLQEMGDKPPSPAMGKQMASKLNMLMLGKKDYYTDFDPETGELQLFDTSRKQDFQDTGARYPSSTSGILSMLRDIDSSRN